MSSKPFTNNPALKIAKAKAATQLLVTKQIFAERSKTAADITSTPTAKNK